MIINVLKINFLRQLFRFIAVCVLVSTPLAELYADEPLGVVIRSYNMPGFPSGYKISGNSEIRTGANQKIAVKTPQGDTLVAGENSSIKLVKPGFFQQLFGKIYYFISKRTRENRVQVQTTTATIGVRGTTFVVDSQGNQQKQDTVSLQEGELNFESNDDEYFKLYQLRQLDDFELFKRQMQTEFDTYKAELEEEFVAYKKSIQLEQGFTLKFDGKKVVKLPFDENSNKQFEEFEAFIRQNTLE
jgi:hypothetical protein